MRMALVIAGTALLFAAGCKDGLTVPETQGLTGRWSWIQSVGGIAGRKDTPSSVGYTRTLVFSPDNTCAFFRDDSLLAVTAFVIRNDKTPLSADGVDVIHYADSSRFMPQMFRFSSADTLILTDVCIDCFTSTYVRRP